MDNIKAGQIVNMYGKCSRKETVSGADALTGSEASGQVKDFRDALLARTDIKQGKTAAIAAVATATA
jgi:hypothetical protein